jgi:hypothetical protein
LITVLRAQAEEGKTLLGAMRELLAQTESLADIAEEAATDPTPSRVDG